MEKDTKAQQSASTMADENHSQRSEDDFDILDVVAARLSQGGGAAQAASETFKDDEKKTTNVTSQAEVANNCKPPDDEEVASWKAQLQGEEEPKGAKIVTPRDDTVAKGCTNIEPGVLMQATSFEDANDGMTKDNSDLTEAERVTTSHSVPGAYACSVSPEGTQNENLNHPNHPAMDTVTATTMSASSSVSPLESGSTTASFIDELATRREGLAHAIPVSNPRPLLPQADAVDLEAQREQAAARQARSTKNRQWMILAGGILLLVILMVGVSLGVYSKKQSNSSSSAEDAPTTAPTSSSPSRPLEWLVSKARILSLLPNATLESIEADPFSPQSLAFDFCKNDPNLETLPDWRIQQRFALAAYFYSTSGDGWKDNDYWLNYDIHECQWYSCPYLHYNINPEEERLTPFPGNEYNNPCNSTNTSVVQSEVYVKLWTWFHDLEGKIPPQVGLLSSLVSISLGYNPNVTGPIPSELSGLSDLQLLDVAETSITGTVPEGVWNLPSLKSLHLMDTHLTGTLPSHHANLFINITGTNLTLP